MTCEEQQQLVEVRCVVASCDVRAEPILVVSFDAMHFKACEVQCNITHYFGIIETTAFRNLLSFGVSYDFVDQKWRILAICHKKINFWEITWKVLGFKTVFKS